jgi:hypothetical protein
MKPIRLWLAGGIAFAIFFMTTDSLPARNSNATKPEASPFAAPEYRQFDFWAGDWDAFESGSPAPVARVHVNRELDGCVLREQYEDTSGLKGQSFSIYDASRGVWHQSWVTNRGHLLVIEGKLLGGAMVLSGADRTADGLERRVRGTWKPVEEGVRETAVTSSDGGRTWRPWFDLVFRPHRP